MISQVAVEKMKNWTHLCPRDKISLFWIRYKLKVQDLETLSPFKNS